MLLHIILLDIANPLSSFIQADMATTLSETLEYLTQVKLREVQLQEEVKQLRHVIGLITGMHPSVQKYMQSPRGTPLYMGMNTQLRGMEYRATTMNHIKFSLVTLNYNFD